MRLRLIVLVTALAGSLVHAQAPTAPPEPQQTAPDYRLLVLGYFDADTLAEFNRRIQNYVDLRERAERGVAPLRVTDDPDEITEIERQLTAALRRIRGSSSRGQIFSRRMQAQLKKLFASEVRGATLDAIMQDGPGKLEVDVNETYAKDKPLATMPPNILQLLPPLPADVEYRFVGKHFILRDVRANMVIDEIPKALHCEDCVIAPEPTQD